MPTGVPAVIFLFDDFELDSDSHDLSRNGQSFKAEPVVLRLLVVLVEDAGQLISKADLIERVWDGRAVSENVITVAMVRLRRLLGDTGEVRKFVVNVHGRGYRFVRPVRRADYSISRPAVGLTPTHRYRASFVGRELVMQRLRVALEDARDGQGSVVALIGEPGIGKTRAAEQLAVEAASAGMLVAWGHCQEAGDTPPLWPWAQLVRQLLEKLPTEGATAAAAAAAVAAAVAPAPASELNVSKDRVFSAVVDVLQRASKSVPCLLIVEDLHRANTSTVELLHFWIESIARTRVLLVGTVRSTESRSGAASQELASVLGHRNCTRVAVQRLDALSVSTYVSTVLDDREGTMARAVFAKSEGNPFFMVELARQLSSMTSPELERLAVTHEALELVRLPLLRLAAAGNGALTCAAVIGRHFELRLLHKVLGTELSDIMQSLDDALSSEVLTAVTDSRTAFAFSHDLLRVALYESIPPAELRRLHLGVALELEKEKVGGEAVSAATLAFHFGAAIPDGDLMKAVEYSARAAEDACTMFAYADAMRHLRNALAALALVPNSSSALRRDLLLQQSSCARQVSEPVVESLKRELRDCRGRADYDPDLRRAGLRDIAG